MSDFPTLDRYSSLMIFFTMVLVVALAWKAWKDSGMTLSLDKKEGWHGGLRFSSETDDSYRRESMYEPPVFWAAGNMAAVKEAQAAGIASSSSWGGNSSETEGMTNGYSSGPIHADVLNPY